jgi:hypothetical protein
MSLEVIMEQHVWNTPAEADIAEMVFKRFIDSSTQSTKVFFLQIGAIGQGNVPDTAFMQRFQNYGIPVKSIAASDGQLLAGVYDRETQLKGKILTILEIKWIDQDTAVVDAGWYKGGRSAFYARYQVSRRDKQWIIKGRRVLAVS